MANKTVIFPDTATIHRHYSNKWVRTHYLSGGSYVLSDSGPLVADVTYDNGSSVIKDMTYRNWRALIASGNNATTYLKGTTYHFHSTPGYAYSVVRKKLLNGNWWETAYDTAYGQFFLLGKPSGMSSIAYSEADNAAKTRFIQQCRRQQTSFQGLTFLGEAGETVRMLRGNVKDLSKMNKRYLNDVKRLVLGDKNPRMSRILPRIRDRYLEHSFGMMPLVNDLRSAGETLAKLQTERTYRKFRMITATESSSSHSEAAFAQWNPPGTDLYLNGRALTESKATVTYRGVICTGLDSIDSVNKFVGVDPSNFLPTAWELLPYSWLADYFTNVGNIVDALSFNRSTLRWVARTVVQEKTNRLISVSCVQGQLKTLYDSIDFEFSRPTMAWTGRIVTRDTYEGSLVPNFRFTVGNLSWRRGLNIAAVALQHNSVQRLIRNLWKP